MSSLHRTELEVKLNGLQELMDLKKTIYEQVKVQSGKWPRNTQATMQKKWHFCGQVHYREGIVPDLHQNESLSRGVAWCCRQLLDGLRQSHELIPFP